MMDKEFLLDKIRRTEADLYALQGAIQAYQIILAEIDRPDGKTEPKEDE